MILKKNPDVPSHHYTEAVDAIQRMQGNALPSLDPQFPFAMTRFEVMDSMAGADEPHRHDCYEVLYISEGEGTHVIDFKPHPIQPHTFYFLSKDQVHFWQLTKPLKGYALIFPEEFLEFPSSNTIRTQDVSFFHHVGHAPRLSIGQEYLTKISGLFEDIELEFYNEKERSITVLRSYIHILLTKLDRLYAVDHPDEHPAASSSLVRQFNKLVSEHYLTEHSVQDYAKRIGISASHLRDTVKEVSGYAPGYMIRQKLLLEAKRLLTHSNKTAAFLALEIRVYSLSGILRVS